MFKSFLAFRIAAGWSAPSVAVLEDLMQRQRFVPVGATQEESAGWTSPRGQAHDPMLEVIGGQWIAKLMVERKSVPGSAIATELEARCKAIEEQRGTKPGKREKKELKEEIRLSLLPRAFAKRSAVVIWVDVKNGLLIAGSSSVSAADLVLKQMLELTQAAGDIIPLSMLRTELSPAKAMSEWLMTFEAPAGFTVDRDVELKSSGEDRSVVRYARHSLDIEEVAAHIVGGKVPTQLAMTWDSRVSFTLTEGFAVKGIELLDSIFEGQMDEQKSFDGDVALLTGELSKMLPDLIAALGGEVVPDVDGAKAAAESDAE